MYGMSGVCKSLFNKFFTKNLTQTNPASRLLTKMVTQNLWFVFNVENVKKPVQRVQLHRMQKAFT